MATPHFYIVGKDNSVYLKYSYSRHEKRLEFFTGIHCPPEHWDKKAQRATKRAADYIHTNLCLDKLSAGAIEYARVMAITRQRITHEAFKIHLCGLIGKETKSAATTNPIAYFETYITDRRANAPRGSVQVYTNCLNHLRTYIAQKRITLQWSDFDHSFFHAFTEWLYAKSFKDNHVNKLTSTLVTMLRTAELANIAPGLVVKRGLVSAPKTIPDNIYLTADELRDIANANIPAHLQATRDLFLIGCHTGLRFSDFSRLEPSNIRTVTDPDGNERMYLDVITQKTASRVTIPLKSEVVTIVKRYDYKLPRCKFNSKFNRDLKTIAHAAGLTDAVISVTSHRGKKSTTTALKYELVTTHTARRTFATNAYLAGIPTRYIMSITGHTTEKEFMKYIKIKAAEHALRLSKHQFFA